MEDYEYLGRISWQRLSLFAAALVSLALLATSLPGTVEAESNVVMIPAAGPAGTRASLVGRDFGKRDRVTIDVVGDPGPLAKAWLWCRWRRDRRLFARSPSCAVLVEMDDATREEGCAASSRLQFSR
jgi:hypothetical protein